MKTLNLTQHPATAEQIQAGVIEPKDKEAAEKSLADTKRRYKEHFQINWSNFKRSNKT